MRKNIEIVINSQFEVIKSNGIVGINGENIQGNIIISFENNFIYGVAWLEIELPNGTKGYLPMTQSGNSYVLPIKSSLLSQTGVITMNLRITENENAQGIPIFKSKQFTLEVLDSINSTETIPDEYPSWIDIADAKILEMNNKIAQVNEAIQETNNLNIDVTKEGKTASITLTKKDGTKKVVTISDGTSLQFHWEGTYLGIKTDDEEEYTYVNLIGQTGLTPHITIGSVTSGSSPNVTITGTDENPILNFVLQKGDTGNSLEFQWDGTSLGVRVEGQSDYEYVDLKGATGNGIVSIEKTSTSGLVDTYTITYTNGDTDTIEVTNGKGIVSIAKTSTSGYVDTYTITYNDGSTSTYEVTNGEVSQAQLDDLQKEVDINKLIFNAFPKITGSGETITLNDTIESPMQLIPNASELSQDATPTPTNPQTIHRITGNNTINIIDRNFLNIPDGTKTNANVTATINNGIVTLNGTANATAFIELIKGFNIKAGTYTLYAFNSSTLTGDNRLRITSNGGTTVYYNVYFDTQNNKNTFTINEDLENVWLQVRLASGGTFNNFIIYPQLSVGNVNLSFERYKSQTFTLTLGNLEYCKIGNYSDKFFKNTIDSENYNSTLQLNKWYLKKNIGKVILNGSESWVYGGSNETYTYIINENISNLMKNTNIYSNYFASTGNNKITVSTTTDGKIVLYIENSIVGIETSDNNVTKKNKILTWLGTNNTDLYYCYVTPIDILLNNTLQEELDNIDKYCKSYNEQTNTTQTNADLPFNLSENAIYNLNNLVNRVSTLETE